MMRSAIETSLYAFTMTLEPSLKQVWLNRNKNEECKKECREKFKTGSFIKSIEKKDPKLGSKIQKHYDFTIDYGAHPNQASIIERLYVEERDKEDNPYLMQVGLFKSEKDVKQTIEWIIDTGYLLLQIFDKVFPERFKLSGISSKIY